jgi:ferrochelatase
VARIAGAWHDEPTYVQTLATLLREALLAVESDPEDPNYEPVPVVFTAHSLPLSMAERDPNYLSQLQQTARAVAAAAQIPAGGWRFSYQSAGHTPEPWLKPDLVDVLAELQQAGARRVLVAPVQFVADHLEVLYDVDVAARKQAEQAGIRLERTPSPNARPEFICCLAAVARRTLDRSATAAPKAAAGPANL